MEIGIAPAQESKLYVLTKLQDIVNENEQKSESRVVKQSSRNFRSLGSKSEEGRREVCLFISYLSFKGQLKSSTF